MIAWIWLIHIATGTVGLHVHRIYCACTGAMEYRFTPDNQHDCGTFAGTALQDEKESCCKKPTASVQDVTERASCCSVSSSQSATSNCTATSDCMDDEIIYLKLDTDLGIEKLTQAHFDLVDLSSVKAQIFLYPDRIFIKDQQVPACFRGPPNKPFGKTLLPRIQSWLC